VVSTFDVTPAESTMLVSPASRRIVVGARALPVRFHGTGAAGEVVALVARRATAPLVSAASTGRRTDGVVRLDKSDLRPGRYDLLLVDQATGTWDARTPVWVYAARDRPRLRTEASSYDVGDSIRVRFTGAPGNLLDWVGIFRCFRICRGAGWYLMYRYTHTHVEGRVVFGADTYLGEGVTSWPLPPGRYIARLFVDDSYHAIGRSNRFTITP
jgi:hypothetical protein